MRKAKLKRSRDGKRGILDAFRALWTTYLPRITLKFARNATLSTHSVGPPVSHELRNTFSVSKELGSFSVVITQGCEFSDLFRGYYGAEDVMGS